MMKRLALLLCAAASGLLAQTVTGVTFTEVTHSAVRLNITTTGSVSGLRLRYVPSPGTCASAETGQNVVVTGRSTVNLSEDIGGLAASTTYNVCPEVTSNNSTWSTGFSTSVTTLALPATHPALPIAPATFDTSYPDTTGFTSLTLANDCSDWDTKVNNTAVPDQLVHGYIINVPHTAVCKGTFNITARAADMTNFLPANVNATANTITITSHPFNEGDQIVFGLQYACLPGTDPSVGNNVCGKYGAIQENRPMYVHKVDANTIQIYSNGVGSSIVPFNGFPGTANGGYDQMYWAKYPRLLKPIIIRTDVADSQFVPEKTRVTPAWSSMMPKFVMPGNIAYATDVTPSVHMCCAGRGDSGEHEMAANIRFVGIEMTSETDGSGGDTSSDPLGLNNLISISPTTDKIILDRCYIHPPTNYIANKPISWNGLETAIVDSYLDRFTRFHVVSNLGIAQTSANQFTINAGNIVFAPGKSGTLGSTVTVNLSGAGSGTGYVYYDFKGKLNISGPPGVTPTCTAVGVCSAYTSDTKGGGLYVAGSTPTLPTVSVSDAYGVTPVFSTQSNGTNPNIIWDDTTVFFNRTPGAYELGTRFVASVNGYITGIQFFKPLNDTGTSHTVTLWDDNGNLLARSVSSSESSLGWVTTSVTPVAVTAGQVYIASYNTGGGGFMAATQLLMNRKYTNGNVSALGTYAVENGWGNSNDNWPKNNYGRTSAGIIGLFRVTNGAIASTYNADTQTAWGFKTEGCQCMLGGEGPGPWVARNNYIEGAGNLWHHDDSLYWNTLPGYPLQARGDATYERNTFKLAPYAWLGGPNSDGLEYYHRQDFETKGMNRIKFLGNVFDTAINDVAFNGLTIGSYNLAGGLTDFDYQHNEFRHIPGVFDYSANSGLWPIPKRFRFKNNLLWDFDTRYQSLNGGSVSVPPNNWLLNGGNGMEDFIIDHNTFVGNQGRVPVIMGFMGPDHSEGFQVTNNIFYVDSQYMGVMSDYSTENGQSTCTGGGWTLWKCKVANGLWSHNVMMPSQYSASNPLWNTTLFSNATQSTVSAEWSNTRTGQVNYFPSGSGLDVGYFYLSPDKTQGGDFHLKANYCSGCGQPATDGKDVGVDMDGLRDAEGYTTLISAVATSDTTATINFVAPDSQSCPVDYSSTDDTLVSSFTRATDSGTGRVRNVSLTGLTGRTVYYFRINCAVQQPKSKFRTLAPVTITQFSVTGTVSGLSGVAATITITSNGTVTTDASGVYTKTGLVAGTYTITPSLTNYTFSPTSLSVTVTSANLTGKNFTATFTGGGGTGISPPAAATAAGFTNLTFDDEFDTLDLSTDVNGTNHKWYPGVMFACSPPSGNMAVSAGVLDLKWTYGQASCYDTPVDTTIMTHNHTSTMTAAAGQTFKYGYFEARMRWDVAPYVWSAFWLNGEYGTGARFMELDIFEFVNAGGYGLYGTLHDWSGGSDVLHDGSNLLSPSGSPDYTQYHTIGCLWTSTTVKWYMDGVLLRTATPPAVANSGPPLYLMLSQQVGQNWSTGAPNGTPAYNNYIDWVRVWQ